MKAHMGVPALKYLIYFQEILAVVFVVYVLIRYIGFLVYEDLFALIVILRRNFIK